MASILMYSAQVGGVFIQSGRGVPTHISPIGSEYTDMDTAIVYQNIDGIATWVEFLTNASTGATINGNISATTVTTNGLTANTATIQSIFDVNYINFNTNPLVPSPTGGTLFYDSAENALSYKPNSLLNDVTVNIGFENLIEIYNQTGSQINNGQPVTITGATILDDLPTVALAIGAGDDLFQVDGIATHDIPNNSSGFITNFGKVHDISLTGFSIGELVYLSQKEKGKLTSFSDLYVTGRTTELGHVIDNSVNGTLQVEINNESKITKNTASEINIFGINNTSSGVFEFTGITKTSNTTFSVAPAKGWIIDNETDPLKPTAKLVIFSGATNIDSPYRTTNTISYLLLTSGGTLTIQPTVPTPQQRRRNIYLGKIGHPDKLTFSIAFQVTDYMTSPVSQLRDMFIPIPLINNGIYPYPNTGLTMSNTAGELYGLGITYPSSPLNPNTLSISASTPVNFQYRTQTGGTLTTTTLIDPTKWDNGGVLTTVGGGSNSSTNQRIYLLQDGSFRMQYGQFVYSTLADAIANASNESFVTFPNFRDNGILIGILSVNKNATNLTDVNQGKFLLVSKFGESVGAAGGLSTTSLQQAYNNSTSPQIVTNNSLDGLKIKSGTGSDLSPNYVVLNNAGDTTGQWLANGELSATSVSATTYYGLPKDVFVTGGTFGGNSATFTNNTGGTFTVTGFTNNTFTGGTVNGLTANTISATTYYNLPPNQFSEAYNVRTWSLTNKNISVNAVDGNPFGIFFKPDGTRMYIMGGSADRVYQFSLSTPWDVSTATVLGTSLLVSGQDTGTSDLYISPNGLILFVIGGTNDRVYRYDLSVAWDISTGVFLNSYNIVGFSTNPTGLYFKPDGSKLFIVDDDFDSVFNVDLSTPWDLTTAVQTTSFSLLPYIGGGNAISFNNDGSKMYVLDNVSDDVTEFNLSIPWDITTSSYVTDSFTFFTELTPGGLYYNETQQVAYVVGNNVDRVFGINTSTSGLTTNKSVELGQLYVDDRMEVISDALFQGSIRVGSNVTSSNVTTSTLTVNASANIVQAANIGSFAGAYTHVFCGGLIPTGLKQVNIGAGGLIGSSTEINLGSTIATTLNSNALENNFKHNVNIDKSLKVEGNSISNPATGTILFYDTFTEVSNTALQSHIPDVGLGWTKSYAGTGVNMQVFGGLGDMGAAGSATNLGVIYVTNDTFTNPDYEINTNITSWATSDDSLWVYFRYLDLNNYYAFRISLTTTDFRLYKRVGGVLTLITGSVNITIANTSQILTVRVIGDSISLLLDGVLLGTFYDSDLTAGGKCGVGLGNTNVGLTTDDMVTTWKLNYFKVQEYKTSDLISNSYFKNGSLYIGNVSGDTSAKVQIDSTSQGFLPPRMTETQKNAIVAPATSLLVYQTNGTDGYYYYNGSSWAALGGGTVTQINSGNGMNFTTITTGGTITLGTPSSVTLSSTNSVSSTTHTHAFVPGGSVSEYIRGDGSLAMFPTDIRVTGGTYSNGTAVFTNNTGGTFTVTGFSTPFTGGTVNGLTANTISATTYQNLPVDVRVTGGTYSNGTTTFTNNTGGTFSIAGYYTGFTGGVINSLTATSVSATSISALTYNGYVPADNSNVVHITGVETVLGSKTFSPTVLASANVARGTTMTPTLAAIANSDTLIGLDINPTFSAGSYTNVTQYALRVAGNAYFMNNLFVTTGTTSYYNNHIGIINPANNISFRVGSTDYLQMFGNTGNIVLQNGGSYVDAGYRLDVLGKVRLSGDTLINGNLTANTISATTYYNLPKDVFVTGGTFSSGTATFTNNTGGTFNVTGYYTGFTGGVVNGLTANTISATTYYGLPKDVFVTSGTYSNGTTVFTNNTGGTFNVSGYYTGFTGGVVNGLTANTISATTYQNLPVDVRVTGGTFSSGTAVFTNNTGGTFSVSGFSTATGSGTFSGGTVSGGTTFTAGLTANTIVTNTISATTYQNLPPDIYVTGGTYSNGTATFGNTTGGTFNVTGFPTGTTAVTFTQTLPATGWTFTHNLGIEKPMITVYNSSNQVIIPQEITAISSSTLYITFPVPVAGYAIAGGGVVSQQTEEISIITAIIFG